MMIISLKLSLSLAHQLCTKDRGNTKAALPSTMSSNSTQNSQASSTGFVFCNEREHFNGQSTRSNLMGVGRGGGCVFGLDMHRWDKHATSILCGRTGIPGVCVCVCVWVCVRVGGRVGGGLVKSAFRKMQPPSSQLRDRSKEITPGKVITPPA